MPRTTYGCCVNLFDACRSAMLEGEPGRLRQSMAARALVATGQSEEEVAEILSVSRTTVTALLSPRPDLAEAHPGKLLAAAAPILRAMAGSHGYGRLAVFGSVARREAHPRSDIDLQVQPPAGASTFDFLRFKRLLEQVLGRDIDLVPYGGLNTCVDYDVLRDATLL